MALQSASKLVFISLGLMFSLGAYAQIHVSSSAGTSKDVETDSMDLDTVYVWGKREAGIGEVASASEGTISFGDFADRPLLRAGELAEVVPGLAVTQHSGTGKANQYFLRGFNLDHGTDFSVSLDGVPLNLRTNAHGQGYLDLNILIPEIVETIKYRKGSYFADVGDFSAAGSAAFETSRDAPAGFAALNIGEHGYGRVTSAKSLDENTFAAVDLTTSAGPWVHSEGLRKGNLYLHRNMGNWALSGVAY